MKKLLLVLILASTASAQKYVGVASCVNSGCHGATRPLSTTRVLQNEYFTWLGHDRHAQAYNILFSADSARIAKNMRMRKPAYEEPLCLDCHATHVAASQQQGRIDLGDGIQCETCHGPASGWRAEHMREGWTHAQSVARGMLDLRNLTIRAAACNACHVGTQSKEVDHELIASGHPLLIFELDNYTESMPPHWNPNATHGLRAWAVGQAVKFSDAAGNLARHAHGERWPEFSDMSCTNCHHELKNGKWRQERGWPDRAGLPAWSPQHWSVLRPIVARVDPAAAKKLDALVPQLAVHVARMHDRKAIAQSADAARAAIDGALPRIQSASWSDEDVRAMIRAIAAGDAPADVQSAEQIALSLQSLAAA
ncbi:MAG TPA: multiheme c-type cytochrome, partial [Thermoanaerobaculia bacterium]